MRPRVPQFTRADSWARFDESVSRVGMLRAESGAVIDVLPEKGLTCMLQHADSLERLLGQHAPHETAVALSLTDDVSLRSDNSARLQMGTALAVEE
jgi:hypothetical protein